MLSGYIQQESINRKVRQALRPVRTVLGKRLFAMLFGKLPVLGKVEVDMPEGKRIVMYAGPKDEISTLLYFHGYEGYEHETLELFRRLCQRAEVIFDIGANVGLFSVVAATANPRARIYGFEPVERVYQLYKRNLAKNHCDNVHTELCAMTRHNGEVALFVPSGDTPTYARTMQLSKGRRGRRVRVPAIRGDSYMRKRELTRLDLIKIDTETTEPQVFEGFSKSLAKYKPDVICEVLPNHGTEAALMEIFGPLGYRYYHITDRGLVEQEAMAGDQTHRFRNFLFSARGVDPELIRKG